MFQPVFIEVVLLYVRYTHFFLVICLLPGTWYAKLNVVGAISAAAGCTVYLVCLRHGTAVDFVGRNQVTVVLCTRA